MLNYIIEHCLLLQSKQHMRFSILLLVVVVMVIACNESADNKKGPPNGKRIYHQYCTSCHGEDGQMAANGALPLPLSKMELDDRIFIITEGRRLMMPFKEELTDAEIRAVAVFTLSEFKQTK